MKQPCHRSQLVHHHWTKKHQEVSTYKLRTLSVHKCVNSGPQQIKHKVRWEVQPLVDAEQCDERVVNSRNVMKLNQAYKGRLSEEIKAVNSLSEERDSK